MRRWRQVAAWAVVGVLVAAAAACRRADGWTPYQAAEHLGERGVVCGVVASTYYAAGTRGNPTFINLGEAYPNQPFYVVIWREDRAKFGRPEATYDGADVCVAGVIGSYRGVPQVIVSEPEQIRVRQGTRCRWGRRGAQLFGRRRGRPRTEPPGACLLLWAIVTDR